MQRRACGLAELQLDNRGCGWNRSVLKGRVLPPPQAFLLCPFLSVLRLLSVPLLSLLALLPRTVLTAP